MQRVTVSGLDHAAAHLVRYNALVGRAMRRLGSMQVGHGDVVQAILGFLLVAQESRPLVSLLHVGIVA